MSGQKKCLGFQTSDYFFRLTSESIRLISNSALKHRSLDEVVESRVERAAELASSYDADDLRTHLRLIPADGDVELKITILETSADTIAAALPALEDALGQSVRMIEAISIILFDIVVERNATEVLTKLGLTSKDASDYKVALKQRISNVIPFR